MLFSTKRFQPICLPCSLTYLCLLHNLSVSSTSSLSACLTQACLSVWSQDISRGAAAVRLRTRGTRAVGLIANIVEIFATHKNNKVRLLKKASHEPTDVTSDVLTHGHSTHGSRLTALAGGTQSILQDRPSHPRWRSTGSSCC